MQCCRATGVLLRALWGTVHVEFDQTAGVAKHVAPWVASHCMQAPCELVTHNRGVETYWDHGRQWAGDRRRVYAKLWRDIWARGIPFTGVRWRRAHCRVTDDMAPGEAFDVIGNGFADKYAKKGTALHALDLSTCNAYEQEHADVIVIANHLAAVISGGDLGGRP